MRTFLIALLTILTFSNAKAAPKQTSSDKAAMAAGDYLCNSIFGNGTFQYETHPLKAGEREPYNWLRHCGTVASLCQLHARFSSKKRYLETAREGSKAILRRLQVIEVDNARQLVFVSNESGTRVVKTGGCALAIIALCKLQRAQGKSDFKDAILGLSKYLEFCQTGEGELRSKLILSPKGNSFSTWRSEYYQGEALVALALCEREYPSADRRTTIQKLIHSLGLTWLDKFHSDINTPFDHWGMIGLAQAYPFIEDDSMTFIRGQHLRYIERRVAKVEEERKRTNKKQIGDPALNTFFWAARTKAFTKQSLMELAIKYCDKEVKTIMMNSTTDLNGSFIRFEGRMCPAATRIEAIRSIQSLAEKSGNGELVQTVNAWNSRLEKTLGLIRLCQYTNNDIKGLGIKKEAVGGIRDHIDPKKRSSVRIDYCQHAISALLGWSVPSPKLEAKKAK